MIVLSAGLAGAIFYVVHHIAIQTTLFLVAGLIERRGDSTAVDRLGGLAKASPLLAILFFVPAMNLAGIPPLFLQMLTHLVARAAMEGEGDAFTLRAAECLFRTQRAAITQGATLLADEEVVENRHADGDLGALGRLLTEAGAPCPFSATYSCRKTT